MRTGTRAGRSSRRGEKRRLPRDGDSGVKARRRGAGDRQPRHRGSLA